MKTLLPFIVVGLAHGSVYGLAGMGLVLTYKTAGIFNFAHGAVATAAAYLFYELRVNQGVPWPIAAIIVVVVVGGLGGALMERAGRVLVDASSAMKIVGTVGLVLAIQGYAVHRYGAATRNFPNFLPTDRIHLPGVYVSVDQIILVVFAFVAAAALYVFFRTSRLGIAMRGVVDDPDLVGLSGTSAPRVRTWSWMIGFAFAAVSGILLAPLVDLDAFLLTLLVVQAFGAAAIGLFSSLPFTYLGGLLIGVMAYIGRKYALDVPVLNNIPTYLPFIVLFVVLLVAPRHRLVEAASRRIRLARVSQPVPPRVRAVGIPIVLGAALLVPQIVGTRLPIYTSGVIFVIVFASLSLLVRTSGQVSLCHAAFAAVGAAAFSHLSHGLGLTWPLALLGAGLITVPVGAIVAIPAIRLSGLYLALATLGFGILLERMLYRTALLFGGRSAGRISARPHLGGLHLEGDTGFYYVCLLVAVLALLLVAGVLRSRLGRLLRGMADSPVALATHGTNVNVSRVLVFCISAFLAGIAGGLFGALTRQGINGLAFTSTQSLLWLAILAIAGAGELRAAVVAALLLAVVPDYLGSSRTVTDWEPVVFGLSALGVALTSARDPAAWFRRAFERSSDRTRRSPVTERLEAIT